jgi:hypothetical protein
MARLKKRPLSRFLNKDVSPKEERVMKTSKKEVVEPKGKISFGPFSEPHTIPTGWDVSALNSADQAAWNTYMAELVESEAILPAKSLNEDSETSI